MKVLRTCTCCGLSKPSKSFSWNSITADRIDHCILCGAIYRQILNLAFAKPKDYIPRKWVRKNQVTNHGQVSANDLWSTWRKSA